MDSYLQKVMLLMTLSLLSLGYARAAVGEPIAPVPIPVPSSAIPEPTPSPASPLVQPSSMPQQGLPQQGLPQQDTPQPTLPPIQPIAPASGINPQSRSALSAEPYTLTAGDHIAVTVANVPEFSAQYQVQVNGTVDFPMLGAISVWGMTVQQLTDLLTARYTQAELLYDPTITVSLLTTSPFRIAISGEINRPGSYTLEAADGKLPTLTQAIQKAGGITELADLRQITLIRARRSGVDETFQINLWELLQSGDLRQDITLRDGDSIILTRATAPMNPAEAGLIGAATVSPAFIQVGVLGETRQSGVVQVPPNTPLNQVLLAAGGFNNRARRGSVELIRLNRDGTVVRRRISIDFSKGINEATNPVLHNRDVVLVGRNFIASLSDTLTAILGPVNQVFSIFTLFNALFPSSSSSNSNIIVPAGGSTTVTPTTSTSPNSTSNSTSTSTSGSTSTNSTPAATTPAAGTSPNTSR